jgi:hypothetical protein
MTHYDFFRYTVPGKKAVMRALEKKNEEMHNRVLTDLKNAQGVSLTHDGWTSMNTESFDTVTAHLISEDWELKSMVLQTKKIEGQHTGENISKNLLETTSAWGITKVTSITTDNAANEQKAVKLLDWNRFGCYGHRINLVVKKSLNIPEVSSLLKKGRRLVTFFHQSSSVNDLLMIKQKDPSHCRNQNDIGHKLIMDCVTRWNSTLSMLERLIEQMPYITAVANDISISKSAGVTIKSNLFTFEEQTLAEKLVQILEPFLKATQILCAQNNPTMHKVITTKMKIMKFISIADSDDDIIRDVKR